MLKTLAAKSMKPVAPTDSKLPFRKSLKIRIWVELNFYVGQHFVVSRLWKEIRRSLRRRNQLAEIDHLFSAVVVNIVQCLVITNVPANFASLTDSKFEILVFENSRQQRAPAPFLASF